MSQGFSQCPIAKLLGRVLDESGLRRSEFIKSLGYKSVTGGLRRLDEWLEQGEGDDFIIDRIVKVYNVDPAELEQALLATADEQSVEADAARIEALKIEHERFRPYIHVEGESSVPSSITMFGLTGGRLNRIALPPEIENQSLTEQLPALAGLMRDYLRKYDGFCPFFGRAVAFRLVHWNESFRFGLDGQFLEKIDGPFRRPQAAVRIGNKVVEGLFREG